jgi:hypothetical protein
VVDLPERFAVARLYVPTARVKPAYGKSARISTAERQEINNSNNNSPRKGSA